MKHKNFKNKQKKISLSESVADKQFCIINKINNTTHNIFTLEKGTYTDTYKHVTND